MLNNNSSNYTHFQLTPFNDGNDDDDDGFDFM